MVTRLRFDSRRQDAGRNWVAPQAQKRLYDEAAHRYRAEQRNAVSVHGTPIRYYTLLQTGRSCTCHLKVESKDGVIAGDEGQLKFGYDFKKINNDPGGTAVDNMFDEDWLDNEQPAPQVNNAETFGLSDDIFANDNDCACCFRTGWVGGYTELHHQRTVMDTQMAVDGAAYSLDNGVAPHSLVQDGAIGAFVEYEVQVPWGYSALEYGVFNNRELLPVGLYNAEGQEIDHVWMREQQGTTVRIRVMEVQRFTHVVLNFALPTTQLVADFPQAQVNVDYTRFDNTAQQSMVVTDAVPQVQTDDVVVKMRNTQFSVWSCQDATPHALENGFGMGFTVQVRSVQPDELLYGLAFLHTL